MTESELEQIAALIDGGLDESERQEVLARLALAGDDQFAVFVEMLEAVDALESGAAADGAEAASRLPGGALAEPGTGPAALEPPFDSPGRVARGIVVVGRRRSWAVRAGGGRFAIAAAVAAAVIGGTMWLGGRPGGGPGPTGYAVLLQRNAPDAAMPALERPWAVRGSLDGLAGQAFQARFGATLVDLLVAGEASNAGDELGTLLAAVPGGLSDEAETCRRAGEGAVAPAARRRARDACAAAVDRIGGDAAFYRLGAWAEAARIAAARHDARFFAAEPSTAALREAASSGSVPPAASAAARTIQRSLATDPLDWGLLSSEADGLLRALAGPPE
jgi:hypothetical protein